MKKIMISALFTLFVSGAAVFAGSKTINTNTSSCCKSASCITCEGAATCTAKADCCK